MVIFLTLFALAIISFLLTLFSMRGFAQISAANENAGLYLISNPLSFNLQTLSKLFDLCIQKKTVFSLERLYKGGQAALAIYAPREIVTLFPELSLVELIDYVTKTTDKTKLNAQNSLVWQPNLNKGVSAPNFLQNLNLEAEQQFCFQVVARAQKTGFKIVVRLLVSEVDINRRIKLAQRINFDLEKAFGQKQTVLQTSQRLFKAFVERSYIVWGHNKELTFEELFKYLN